MQEEADLKGASTCSPDEISFAVIDLRTFASGALGLMTLQLGFNIVLIELSFLSFVLFSDKKTFAIAMHFVPRSLLLPVLLIASIAFSFVAIPGILLAGRGILSCKLGWFLFIIIVSLLLNSFLLYNIKSNEHPIVYLANESWTYFLFISFVVSMRRRRAPSK